MQYHNMAEQTVGSLHDRYIQHKNELFEKYPNKYLVISKNEVKWSFDKLDEAYRYGVDNFWLGNFMAHKCVDEEPTIRINPVITITGSYA